MTFSRIYEAASSSSHSLHRTPCHIGIVASVHIRFPDYLHKPRKLNLHFYSPLA